MSSVLVLKGKLSNALPLLKYLIKNRVNVGGKLDIVCFDKTGTLTEDGLDVLGIRLVHRPAMRYKLEIFASLPDLWLIVCRFSDIFNDASTVLPGASFERDPTVDYERHKAALYTMATCHSLRLVDGQLIGDPLDYKMFNFTGWSLEEGGQKAPSSEDGEHNTLTPTVVRPPAGMEYEIGDSLGNTSVSLDEYLWNRKLNEDEEFAR